MSTSITHAHPVHPGLGLKPLHLMQSMRLWWHRRSDRRASQRLFFYQAEKQLFRDHLANARRSAGTYHNFH